MNDTTTQAGRFSQHGTTLYFTAQRGRAVPFLLLVGLMLWVGSSATAFAQTETDALLRASNTERGDAFGRAVSIDGPYALVGARNEAGPSNTTIRGGAAYVFERSPDGWTETSILRAPNAEWGDRFGESVAIDGRWAVVGAFLEDGPSNEASDAGAAYLFRQTAQGEWVHVQTIRASNAEAWDRFGQSVAMDGARVLVGATAEAGRSNTQQNAGAVYVFARGNDDVWREEQVLRADNADADDQFGTSVAINESRVLVGATGEAGPTNGAEDAGAAYLFERQDDGSWSQTGLFRASNADRGDLFGWSVSLDGPHAVVGASHEDGPSNGMRRTGAVYVFERSEAGWPSHETALIRAPNGDQSDQFGHPVSVDGGRILAGAVREDGASDAVSDAGAAYLFENTPRGWTAVGEAPLRASSPESGARFGQAVVLEGTRALVGSNGDSGGGVYAFGQFGHPTATLGRATDVRPERATVSGGVRPAGRETTVRFEYRKKNVVQFRSVTASQSPVQGTGKRDVHVSLQGLQPGAQYDVRIVASNSVGTDTSKTAALVTPPSGVASPYTRTIRGNSGPGDEGWRMLSQPAAGVTRAAIEDDLNFDERFSPILYRWTGSRWVAQTQSSDPLPRGEGFILYLFDDTTEPLEPEGIAFDVSRGTEAPVADATVDGLSQDAPVHLLGNPYETGFNLDSLAQGDLPGAGFQATVQVWNPTAGRYRQIVQGSRTPRIAAWQGFFVERSVTGDGQTHLTFGAGGRLDDKGSLIGSQSRPPGLPDRKAAPDGARTHAELNVQVDVTDSDGDTTSTDRATLWMDERARTGYDGYEARDLAPPGGGRYVTASFPIQHRGRLVQRAQAANPIPAAGAPDAPLPLSVRGIEVSGTATLSWPTSLQNRVPEGWAVTLVDTKTGEEVDLRTQSHSFTLTKNKSEKAPSDARFRIQLEPGAQPVELSTFEAAPFEDGVRLRWTTATEEQNTRFRVLRRAGADGGVWEQVGMGKAVSKDGSTKTYQFTDTDVPYPADSVSYQLEQVEADGRVHKSGSVAVSLTTAAFELFGTYPNPARERATVRFSVPSGHQDDDVHLRLYDVLGRQVRTVAAGSVTGRHEKQLDVSDLSSGIYVLQLNVGERTRTQRMTVVR
jgi:hypothetical protein